MHYFCFWNMFNFLSFACAANTFDRYPYVLPKCCDSKGKSPEDGNYEFGECGSEESEVVLLPKELFPAVSTDLEHIEVELRNWMDRLNCPYGRDYRDFSIDFAHDDTSRPFGIGGKKGFAAVTFSGDIFLDRDGSIYRPHQFCISSRTNNTNPLIKTFRCGKPFLHFPRCCGGQQSFVAALPNSTDRLQRDWCSTPSLGKKHWSPSTSNILRVYNPHDMIHFPRRENNAWYRNHLCTLFRVKKEDDLSLAFLEDGRLQVSQENRTEVLAMLDNFCIDGLNVEAGENSPGNQEEITKADEAVVVYDCSSRWWEETSTSVKNIVGFPTCNDLAHSFDKLDLQPPSLQFVGNNPKVAVALILKTAKNGASKDCRWGYENLILDSEASMRNHIKKYDFLYIGRIHYWDFCVQRVFPNALELKVCHNEERNFKYYVIFSLVWWLETLLIPTFVVPGLFYVSIAVVYILRKDKEPVFRCTIVAYSISMALAYVFIPMAIRFRYFNLRTRFVTSMLFFYVFAFSWMSVLCSDLWLTITFLQPGRKSTKRVWGYVALNFTLSTLFIVTKVNVEQNYNEGTRKVTRVLDYLLYGSAIGLPCINLLLFIATAVKLWITQHSSDISNQKMAFLLYFKLFLLTGLRWVIDLLILYYLFEKTHDFDRQKSLWLLTVPLILVLLHPVVLFFFLVCDGEMKRYLETKYPRMKSQIKSLTVVVKNSV